MKTFGKFMGAVFAIALTACGTPNTNPMGPNPFGLNGPNGNNFYGQGGCQPIQNGLFSFTAQGARIESIRILAGNIPTPPFQGTYGQVVMGGQPMLNNGFNNGFNNNGMNGNFAASYMGSNGSIPQLVISGPNMISGTIQLSQYAAAQLMQYSGGGWNNGWNNGMNPNMQGNQFGPCVSSIGLWLARGPNGNGIIGATAYFYLNSSPTPIAVQL